MNESSSAQLKNIAEALPRILGSDERLASFAHDIGHALRTLHDDILRQVRNLLASATIEDKHRAGLVSGMLEMIDGYRAAAASARREDNARAELRQGLLRDVVAELSRRSLTTSELAVVLRKTDSEISRALNRLRKLDLVDSARDPLNGRVYPHRLSMQGRMLAERAGLSSLGHESLIDKLDAQQRLYEEERKYEKEIDHDEIVAADVGDGD